MSRKFFPDFDCLNIFGVSLIVFRGMNVPQGRRKIKETFSLHLKGKFWSSIQKKSSKSREIVKIFNFLTNFHFFDTFTILASVDLSIQKNKR